MMIYTCPHETSKYITKKSKSTEIDNKSCGEIYKTIQEVIIIHVICIHMQYTFAVRHSNVSVLTWRCQKPPELKTEYPQCFTSTDDGEGINLWETHVWIEKKNAKCLEIK